MCLRCGQRQDDQEQDSAGPSLEQPVNLQYIGRNLHVSESEANRIRGIDEKRILAEKKLVLVLDIDHTLLNSGRFTELSADENMKLAKISDNVSLYHLPKIGLWTKLRPYLREFLARASQICELYLYTMGNQHYALEMQRIIDEDRSKFGDRVISNELIQRQVKGLDVVLGAERQVLIVDDSEHVWPSHGDNLIQIERYHFLPCSTRSFGIKAKAWLERDSDEQASTGALAHILGVLENIHRKFFEKEEGAGKALPERDVRSLLKAEKRKILENVEILLGTIGSFSSDTAGVWDKMRKKAEGLGAVCGLTPTPSVTHVVCTTAECDQAKWARAENKLVVHPDWIYHSHLLWHRMEEKRYSVR